jgi:hypothetical protein
VWVEVVFFVCGYEAEELNRSFVSGKNRLIWGFVNGSVSGIRIDVENRMKNKSFFLRPHLL